MGLGGEEEPLEDEPVVKDMPDAFADGEKLCPCPDEEEEIEIDFNDLAFWNNGIVINEGGVCAFYKSTFNNGISEIS